MPNQLHDNIKDAYSYFDQLRERLEFNSSTEELKLLNEALKKLNKYLSHVEKFDRSKK